MTTLAQAREAAYQRFVTEWDDETLFVLGNENSGLDGGDVSWVRVSAQEALGGQDTIGTKGTRKFRRNALLFVQIFTTQDAGEAESDSLAGLARGIFEGESFSGLDFGNVQVRRIGPSGKWHAVLVEAAFAYDEEK